MSKFISNKDIINLFKKRDVLKEDTSLTNGQRKKEIAIIDDKVISSLSFLVYNNTKHYYKFSNYEDLVQEGFVGLVKATKRFNYNLSSNFFVYAESWINHSVKRAASRFDVIYNPKKTRILYAETMYLKEEVMLETPEDLLIKKETDNKIKKVLNTFSNRDGDIVKRIFGLEGYSPQTLREISPVYDLTHERVRQIKNEVITKLRKNKSLAELY